jgi:hypothetical protein
MAGLHSRGTSRARIFDLFNRSRVRHDRCTATPRTGAGVIDSVGISPTAHRISPAHVTQSSKDPKIEPSISTDPYFFLRTVFRFVVFLAVFFAADFVFDFAFFTMLPS